MNRKNYLETLFQKHLTQTSLTATLEFRPEKIEKKPYTQRPNCILNSDKPLISIITITYNAERTLEDTIQSVINQTYKNIEYIIIDGGSTDGTLDIIRKYENAIDFWLSEKDKGISDAFNKGIEQANGEIIGIINADDWYEKNTIELVETFLIACPEIDIVCGRMQYWEHNHKSFVFDSNPNLLSKEMTINHPTTFIKRKIYEKFGVFRLDFKYAMDYELLLRAFKGGATITAIPEILANMRLDGVSDVYWKQGFAEVRKAKIIHGHSVLNAWLYYYFQLSRRYIKKFLLFLGLKKIVLFYKKRFSIIKKEQSS